LIDRAIKTGTGARALHSEIERVLMPHFFNLVDYKSRGIKSIEIDADLVTTPTSI